MIPPMFALLVACATSPVSAPLDTAPDIADSGGSADTAGTHDSDADTADSADTGDTNDTAAPCTTRWYPDADQDGAGADAGAVEACDPPDSTWTLTGGDCDDGDPDVHPGAPDVCGDALDADCDGSEDECAWSGRVDLGGEPKLYATVRDSQAGGLLATGDVTGDGVPDLFTATFGFDSYGGGGYVVPGPITTSGALDAVGIHLQGHHDTTYGAGRSVGIGDVDGDGVADLAIGVPYYQNALHIFLGPLTTDREVAEPDLVLTGRGSTYAGHGGDLADLNDDGVADAIVGAYLDSPGAYTAGTVFVKYGPLVADVDLTADADHEISGEEATAYTGRHIRAGGDLNGDGLGDFVVAAPNATGGAPGSGIVYVVYGPGDLADFSAADGRLLGENAGGGLGIGVSMALGDVDGDGLDDVAAGAYYDGTSAAYAGSAYLILGPAAGDQALSAADIVVRGAAVNQYVGAGVAIGDADRDGVGDLVVGASGTDTSTGAAYLYSAPTAGTYGPADADAVFLGEGIIQFAGAFTTFGDVDGDALPELLVGATGEPTGGSGAGAVYVAAP